MTGLRSAPLVIADRGASADAPEHTIAAFELALDQGADGIALDVHLTRDGQPVVIHDFTLERTTDGAGAVRAHTMREMKRLDAGGWRDRRFRGQRVQTLQEVLERFRDRTRFWIEIKGGSDVYPEIEDRVVSTLEVYEAVDRTLIQSPDPKALTMIRTLNGDVKLGAVIVGASLEPFLVAPGPAQALCPGDELCERTAAEIRKAGLEFYVRTEGHPDQIDRLVAWGVSGIITNRPSLVRTRLGR